MRLTDLRRLNGPNIYTSRPVTVARLELDDLTGHETSAHAGFAARLLAALPGLAGHHCAAGQPGGFTRAMARGTYFGHVTEHVALELSGLAGRDVYFGRTVWAGADGRYDVVMECPWDEPADSPVPRDLLCLALRVVGDVLAERAHHLDATLAEITSAVEQARLGVSTAALAGAARSRGIPVRPGRRAEPAQARLRLPPAAGVGGADRSDLGGRRGHRLRQGAGQAVAGRGGRAGSRGRGRARRDGGGTGVRGPRRAGRGQAAQRQPGRRHHGRSGHRRRGGPGVPARERRRASGDRGEIRARHRLPGPGRRRPHDRRRPGPARDGDRRRRARHRGAGGDRQRRPAPG